MMYQNKLVATIKANGNVLREFEDAVYLPFGTEYSIYIKNLNTVRALVSLSIDGEDVGDGREFIVHPNNDITIERTVKNGNLHEGNRFKFIERTAEVEQHRGIGSDDGIVRIGFSFETKKQIRYTGQVDAIQWWEANNNYRSAEVQTARGSSQHSAAIPKNDVGITVPGSISNQQFAEGSWFPTESTSHCIVLRLLGEENNTKVKRAVDVKAKPKCTSCGKVNQATAKFCDECGTSLTII